MAPRAKTGDENELTRAEQIELRWKELQIEDMEERMELRREAKARSAAERKRQYEDFKKSQATLAHRQSICKHLKGGRNNQFWNGNSKDYSINKNTYPTGEQIIMCTRCGKEVRKPERELKKSDPKLYAAMLEQWRIWSSYPTDNSPSGSKIYEVIHDDETVAA